MIAALLLTLHLAQWWHDTNSHAATARGVEAFVHKRYDAAVAAFGKANAIDPSTQRAYNLGTAQVAAGNREGGSSTLARAMTDPRLRADALFNRGTSALASKAWDSAIRDYTGVLRLRPADGAAKRNLEIALARKAAAQQQGGGGGHPPQKGSSPQPKQSQNQPAPSDTRQNRNAADEALLRSVQQQEQEELRRMHQKGTERVHVGW